MLAAFFFAAVPARGQAPAVNQTAENYSESQTLATNPSTLLSGARAGAWLDEYSALPENNLASQEASPVSDSGNAQLPDAPAASSVTNSAPADQSEPYTPISGRGRVVWVIKSTLWPQHLAAGVLTTGIATARDKPPEDGPHWGGFGERFGVRLTSVAVNGTIEASVGSLWGEDPRYFRVPEESFGARVKNVIKMTFLARRTDGRVAPAYALFIGTMGGNFLSNEWRPDSTANSSSAVWRTFEGLGGHMAGNAWTEFWPDAERCIFHHCKQEP